jgi:formylglycine-generating enzyme required for sulfatase activity
MRLIVSACIYLVALFNPESFAAQINLTGMVSDTIGNPISGAIVFVKNINKKDTTDASGRYAIQDPPVATVRTKNFNETCQFTMVVAHNALRVFVPEKQAISIKVYDVSGKNLFSVAKRVLNQGWQTIKPDKGIPSGRVLVVCVNGSSGLQSNRVFYTIGNGGIANNANYRLETSDLAKRIAAFDTIFVNCKTFKRTVRPVSNYIEVDTIKMKKWPAGSRVLGMKYLPSDTFTMGQAGLNNSVDKPTEIGNAFPVHKVTLSAYYIDSTEVTQADFQDLMQYCPTANPNQPRYAIDNASWYDAARYCNARSKKEQLDTVYSYSSAVTSGNPPNAFHATNLNGCVIHYEKTGYRLPTEAEWEYACRGGTRTDEYWGNAADSLYLWTGNNAGGHTNEVARKLPNAYKLYDMAGNVWEWTNTYTVQYTSDAQTDPVGPLTGTNGVQLRGAAWHEYYGDKQFYSACRHSERQLGGTGFNNVGFRVVLPER